MIEIIKMSNLTPTMKQKNDMSNICAGRQDVCQPAHNSKIESDFIFIY